MIMIIMISLAKNSLDFYYIPFYSIKYYKIDERFISDFAFPYRHS